MKYENLLATLAGIESVCRDIETLAKSAQVLVNCIETADQDASSFVQAARTCADELSMMTACLADFHMEELINDIKDL